MEIHMDSLYNDEKLADGVEYALCVVSSICCVPPSKQIGRCGDLQTNVAVRVPLCILRVDEIMEVREGGCGVGCARHYYGLSTQSDYAISIQLKY